ncbi:hypothetical protein DPMN_043746 [Dreissena polymorpha]|uniref:Uncharacterized protein n=1 Tax=Dreissena polymorpha TaxID=45954 RepID=A0A9D4HYA0_DREPO|nr:hypothetical protein DPMN_043746 [Dreissena polymorpha]
MTRHHTLPSGMPTVSASIKLPQTTSDDVQTSGNDYVTNSNLGTTCVTAKTDNTETFGQENAAKLNQQQ